MAYGCNIGPFTMARLTDGVTYNQIKRIADWQLSEEAQRQALAQLVNAISSLDVTRHWGEGKTSSSDGQRFRYKQKVLQQTWSPRFQDYALEFYSFVADNYAPFYSIPIECTDRDAAYVLDGLLYNESDLAIEEHYTDTHGYTETHQIHVVAYDAAGNEAESEKVRIYVVHEQEGSVRDPVLSVPLVLGPRDQGQDKCLRPTEQITALWLGNQVGYLEDRERLFRNGMSLSRSTIALRGLSNPRFGPGSGDCPERGRRDPVQAELDLPRGIRG